jgi:hypothetical protein
MADFFANLTNSGSWCPKIIVDVMAVFVSWWGGVRFFISLGSPQQETSALVHCRSKRETSLFNNLLECKKTVPKSLLGSLKS